MNVSFLHEVVVLCCSCKLISHKFVFLTTTSLIRLTKILTCCHYPVDFYCITHSLHGYFHLLYHDPVDLSCITHSPHKDFHLLPWSCWSLLHHSFTTQRFSPAAMILLTFTVSLIHHTKIFTSCHHTNDIYCVTHSPHNHYHLMLLTVLLVKMCFHTYVITSFRHPVDHNCVTRHTNIIMSCHHAIHAWPHEHYHVLSSCYSRLTTRTSCPAIMLLLILTYYSPHKH